MWFPQPWGRCSSGRIYNAWWLSAARPRSKMEDTARPHLLRTVIPGDEPSPPLPPSPTSVKCIALDSEFAQAAKTLEPEAAEGCGSQTRGFRVRVGCVHSL